MAKYLKLALVLIIGLILGLTIHGLIEIPALWLLTNWLSDFFFGISWNTWILIHLIFTIIVEILGILIAFRFYKKYCKQ